jgi:hypothetical protein
MVSVKQSPDGTWTVVRDGDVIAAGLTNAAAWREVALEAAQNLGGLIHAGTTLGRLGKATSRTPSMYVDERSRMRPYYLRSD